MAFFSSLSINTAYRTAIAAAIVFFLILNIIVLYANYLQHQIFASEQRRYDSLKTVNELLHTSDDLTKLARLYIATGKEKYKQYFYDILAIREGNMPRPDNYSAFYWDYVLADKMPHAPAGKALSLYEQFTDLNFNDYEWSLLNQASQQMNQLISMEEKAFELLESVKPNGIELQANQGIIARARNILHSNEFLRARANAMEPLEQIQIAVETRTAQNFSYLQERLQYLLYFFQGIVLLALLFCIMAYRYVSRRVMEPIRQLHYQAKQVGMGLYHVRNHISSHNELEKLGNALNDMCDFVEADIKERERLNNLLGESEERFRNMIESAPICMIVNSLDGKCVHVNQALCDMLGYQKHELTVKDYEHLVHPDDLGEEKALQNKLAQGLIKNYQHELRFLNKKGEIIWVLLSASAIPDGSGNPLHSIVQVHNITSRKRNEKEMERLNEQMSSTLLQLQRREHENYLLNKMNEMLLTSQDAEEAYAIICLTAKELFPALSGSLAVINSKTGKLETARQWGEQQLFSAAFLPKDCWALRSGKLYQVNDPKQAIVCAHYESEPAGGYIDLPLIVRGETIGLLSLTALKDQVIDSKGKGLAVTFSENIKLALANINLRDALREQAMHDALTNLYNRRYLEETLPREIKHTKRNKQTLSVVMLDIDKFKEINDVYGHDAGDEILKFVGSVLRMMTRGGDIPCRLGGDEFVLVLLDSDAENAHKRVADMMATIKNTQLRFEGNLLPSPSLSAGIATAPRDGGSQEEILSAADEALYAAKNSGKDKIKIYQAAINKEISS